jgi:hypothetical protein
MKQFLGKDICSNGLASLILSISALIYMIKMAMLTVSEFKLDREVLNATLYDEAEFVLLNGVLYIKLELVTL